MPAIPAGDPVDIHVGEAIRRLRKRYGMSQTALGERLSVTHQQVQKYEHGSNRISVSMLLRVCREFNVDVSAFLPPHSTADNVQATPSAPHTEIPGAQELLAAYEAIKSDRRRAALRKLAKALLDEEGVIDVEVDGPGVRYATIGDLSS